MKKSFSLRLLLSLALLFGAMTAAYADDRFFFDIDHLESGHSTTLALYLDNETPFCGFQADISLPEGMEFVVEDSSPLVSLSDRAGSSYRLMTNLLNPRLLRAGAFSASHTALSGDSGAVMYVTVMASDSFAGGELILSGIHFVDESDRDVPLPDFSAYIGNQAENRFFLPDFKIAAGETLTVSLILDNETPFTAFQTDLYLPQGLVIIPDSFTISSRASDHTLSYRSYDDGRTRITCFSLENTVITGNSGALLSFDIYAVGDVADTFVISLKNQIFTMADAKQYIIPDSSCDVTVTEALVTEILLSDTQTEMFIGDTWQLSATINPPYATNKAIEWRSGNPAVATVSQQGLITTCGVGETVVSANATDGSGVSASCLVKVNPIAVTGISVSQDSAVLIPDELLYLTATIAPDNATFKSVAWQSSDNSIASVDANGIVKAGRVGEAVVTAIAVSNPDLTAQCLVKVVPVLVSSITIDCPFYRLYLGDKFRLYANIEPANATDKSLTWTSSDPSVVSVDCNGNIIAVGIGEAEITANTNDGSGLSTKISFAVEPKDIYISYTSGNIYLSDVEVGNSIQLNAFLSDGDIPCNSAIWTSSNPEVATVDDNGLVKALALGSTSITATFRGIISRPYYIEVERDPIRAIEITSDKDTIFDGETLTLTANLIPATTTDTFLQWLLSEEGIVDIKGHGHNSITVKAISPGVVDILACGIGEAGDSFRLTVIPKLVSSITLDTDDVSLEVSDIYRINATVAPDNATDKSLSWTSSDNSVATVDSDGNITAVAIGETVITAAACDASGLSASCKVTVIPTPVKSVSITADGSTSLAVRQTLQLNALVLPENAVDKTVSWSSSDPGVATVDDSGLVTAVALGRTNVTAVAGGISSSIEIVVDKDPVVAIEIKADADAVQIGETLTLTATLFPSTATNKNIEWTLSESGIVSITETAGLSVTVRALAIGTVDIIATSPDGVSASFRLTVTPKLAQSITLDNNNVRLVVGESFKIIATVLPDDITNNKVNWVTSDYKIAIVTNAGLVKALKVGTCEIIASTADGSNLSAACQIEVVEEDAGLQSVTLQNPDITIINSQIIISGVAAGTTVRLYSLSGLLIRTVVATGSDIILNASPATPYILTIASTPLKLHTK